MTKNFKEIAKQLGGEEIKDKDGNIVGLVF